ncbi:condensation domain-containing protein [Streptomyces sp. NPDC058812]|uniref:condensation domain-containing protein n=1 Tax=unclassified Streptomyces TaxID=2593676 RepID=UPI0036CB5AAE
MSADLAARLAALGPEQRARLLARARETRFARERPAPGQLRLWEAHHGTGGRPVDVVCQAVHLTGARVDLDLLEERIVGFARTHEALRTTFEQTGTEGPRPVVHAELPPRVSRARCGNEEEAHGLARALANEPFDLANGPLLKVVLAQGPSAEEAWLLVVVHNLVFDAWSFELLLDELARNPDERPAAAVPFSRFAHEQRAWIESAPGRAAAGYWAGEVADAPPPLPTDRPRKQDTSRPGRHVEFSLPPEVARGVAGAAQREAATAYTAWLAVAWAALAEFGGRDDVLLGTFTAGRNRSQYAGVVGYLLNVLPVRLRSPGDGTHRSRIRAARDATRAGLAHAAYPGELIGTARRVPGTHPLLDAVFVFDNLGESTRTVQGARVTTTDLDKGTARYDLTLAVYPGPDGVAGWIEYDTDLYEEATARRLAERFGVLAAAMAEEGAQ